MSGRRGVRAAAPRAERDAPEGIALRPIERRLAALAPPGPEEPPIAPLIAVLRESGLLAACGSGGPDDAPAAAGAPAGADPTRTGDPAAADGPVGPGAAVAASGLAHHPARPVELLEALAAVGAASLSAGRLFEGHVNAVKLVEILARGEARRRRLAEGAQGALLAVWGAEGSEPVRIEGGRLRGHKLFASGADVVDRAIVTARTGAGLQLVVLDAERLRGRLHPEEWSASGMRGTASGRCDLDGLAVADGDLLGVPGDYLREPHFQGGVWRYAAVWLGAMRAMTRATAAHLEARGQSEAPLQSARLLRMVQAVETARLWLGAAAREVERPGAAPEAAATAILARLRAADEAVALMAAMDEALGAASFATAHPVERPRRDLQLYLRQADPDGLGRGALATLRADPALARRWALG